MDTVWTRVQIFFIFHSVIGKIWLGHPLGLAPQHWEIHDRPLAGINCIAFALQINFQRSLYTNIVPLKREVYIRIRQICLREDSSLL